MNFTLLKLLDGPWEKARGYLRLDLDRIQAAINTGWSIVFNENNELNPGTIPGDSTIDSVYVSNQGPGHTPLWDKVNLANGVQGRLSFAHLVEATQAAVLVGRESGSVGDFEQITPGRGLRIQGVLLNIVPGEILGSIPPGQQGEDGQDGAQGAPGATGATGATGAAGAAGSMGPPGVAGEDGDFYPVMIPSQFSVNQMLAMGTWSILTNGDTVAPEVVFDSFGNVISVFVPS